MLVLDSSISYLKQSYKLKRPTDHFKDISMQECYIVGHVDNDSLEWDTEALIRGSAKSLTL